jgi:uronate dehydrogenase
MRVVVTGAAGNIGRAMIDHLAAAHEVFLIDSKRVPGRASRVADLARSRNQITSVKTGLFGACHWQELFAAADVVIHLAEDPRSTASWQCILHNNIQTTWNVLEAAVQHRVRRVVYASSGWAVKALELQLMPACYLPDGPKIDSAAPPRPKRPYGVGKACAELMGRMLVDDGKLESFLAVRLGWYEPDPPHDETYRKLRIGREDLRRLMRRAVEAPFTGFHVAYGVSAQATAPYDLSYTRRLLDWEPQEFSGCR